MSEHSQSNWVERFLLVVSVIIGSSLVAIAVFLWSAISYFGTALSILFVLFMLSLMAVCSIISLYLAFSGHLRYVVVLLFEVLCAMSYFSITKSNLPIFADFNIKLGARMSIVSAIESKMLEPNDPTHPGLIRLSFPKSMVAANGDVSVTKNSTYISIIFYMREEVNIWSGFVYRSDNNPPFMFGSASDEHRMLKLRQHWFWVDY